jgi:hypothetical protein
MAAGAPLEQAAFSPRTLSASNSLTKLGHRSGRRQQQTTKRDRHACRFDRIAANFA